MTPVACASCMGRAGSVLLGVLLLACLPGASAHVSAFEAALWAGERPLDVMLEGAPAVVARQPFALIVVAPPTETLQAPDGVDARLVAPTGEARDWFPLRAGRGDFREVIVFDEPGAWSLEVRVGGAFSSTRVEVFPATRYFAEATDDLVDEGGVVAGRDVVLRLQVHDVAGAPAPMVDDVSARVVHEPREGGPSREARFPARVVAPGLVEVEGRWDAPGVLHVGLDSSAWDLRSDALPTQAVLVIDPSEAEVYRSDARETPAPAGLAIASLFAATCLAGAARGRLERR